MDKKLPFKHEDEKNILNKIHPLIRFILPFILVIPFLVVYDITLVIATILLFNIRKEKEEAIFMIYGLLNFMAIILLFPIVSMVSGKEGFTRSENIVGILMKLILIPIAGVIAFFFMQQKS